MKLVFIYGPAAVGKLTVAEALADRTGFKVFHNHLTVDVAKALFEWGSSEYITFVRRLRLSVFEFAAQAGLPGLIFTFFYTPPQSDAFVQMVLEAAQETGFEVLFVQLIADLDALERRVLEPSRREHGKPNDVQTLQQMYADTDVFAPIPFVPSLRINNTKQSPHTVAETILMHFNLSPI